MGWVGAVLGAAGAVSAAAGQRQAGEAKAQAAEYNMAITQLEADAEKDRIRRESESYQSSLQVARAKSGVTSEGTPLMVMAESAANAEVDALNTQWTADRTNELYGMQASSARTAGNIGAGTTLLLGPSKLF
jgi:hypothetical protein